MVVSRYAGGFEFARFGRSDLTKRHTNFHAQVTHRAYNLEYLLEFFAAIVHAAPRRTHTKTSRALRTRAMRRRQNILNRKKLSTLDPSGIVRALRAIGAIFTATTGFDAQQTATLHPLAPPMPQMHLPAL